MSEVHSNAYETEVGAALRSDEGQVVVFKLAEEEFGVEIDTVQEIVRLPEITPVPGSPDFVAGICNLRGNVLPVIDTRLRFGMGARERTDQNRLLVVETGGTQSSLIVDNMREVMRMSQSLVEPPPLVCRGVDREFLSGIVKIDEGKRLILMLDLDEVVALDMASQEEGKGSLALREEGGDKHEESVEEDQLVSFRVAGEEFAFDIAKVREILKVTQVTAVPNVPGYVKGLFTIRSNLLPILDLRGMLGLPSLISERHAILDKAVAEDNGWADLLRSAMESKQPFSGALDARKTVFGKWLEEYNTSSVEAETVAKRLKRARAQLYGAAHHALELGEEDSGKAVAYHEEKIAPLLKIVTDNINELKEVMASTISEDQRALVVETAAMNIGYLVDWVDEVLRIPRSVIDETPSMASSRRKELKAVAKLDNGERLIMIMDESALASEEAKKVLSEMKEEKQVKAAGREERSLAQQSMDEQQLVTFSINKEEYGVRIMKVQEINRATEITAVPRAPRFVDGVTNLRGNVIPVINIRELFGLQDKEVDDRTRIIIVDMGGGKTGLRVDRVNEVLRLPTRDIEKTPSIVVSGGTNKYMEGVCKMDKGKRMIVLLDVEKILDEEELRALSAVMEEPDPREPLSDIDSGEKGDGEEESSKLEIAE